MAEVLGAGTQPASQSWVIRFGKVLLQPSGREKAVRRLTQVRHRRFWRAQNRQHICPARGYSLAHNLQAALRVVLAVEGTTCVPEKQLRQLRHPDDAQARKTVMCGHCSAGVLRALGGGCTLETQGWNPANPVASKRIPGRAAAFRAPSGGRISDWRRMNRAWLCKAQGCASLCTRPPCATVAASSASASISGALRLMLPGGWEGKMFDAMCGLAGASRCSA